MITLGGDVFINFVIFYFILVLCRDFSLPLRLGCWFYTVVAGNFRVKCKNGYLLFPNFQAT
jgi:hypothetical protein